MSEQTPEPQKSSSGLDTQIAVDVQHPDRPLTAEERKHLGLPDEENA